MVYFKHEYKICPCQRVFLHRKNRLTPCTSLLCCVSRHNCFLKFYILEQDTLSMTAGQENKKNQSHIGNDEAGCYHQGSLYTLVSIDGFS